MESFSEEFLDSLPVGIVRRAAKKPKEIFYINQAAKKMFDTLTVLQIALWLDRNSTLSTGVVETTQGKIRYVKHMNEQELTYSLETVVDDEERIYHAYEKVCGKLEAFIKHSKQRKTENISVALQAELEGFYCCLLQQKRNLFYMLSKEHFTVTKGDIYDQLSFVLQDCDPWIQRYGCEVEWLKKPPFSLIGNINVFYFQQAMKNFLAYAVDLLQEEQERKILFSLTYFNKMVYFSIDVPYTGTTTPTEDENYNLESAMALLLRMNLKPLLVHEPHSLRFLLSFPNEVEDFSLLLSHDMSASPLHGMGSFSAEVLAFSSMILRYGTEEEKEESFLHLESGENTSIS